MSDSTKPPVTVTHVARAKDDPALSAHVIFGDLPRRPPADFFQPFHDDDEIEAVRPEYPADEMLSADPDTPALT